VLITFCPELEQWASKSIDQAILQLAVFNSLRNEKIAKRLFASETTVKKHIQNIFEKVKAKNRTAILHKCGLKLYIDWLLS
jgi:DNA-binding NarL/FixJ family response regulator